jgi:hypothetical protein
MTPTPFRTAAATRTASERVRIAALMRDRIASFAAANLTFSFSPNGAMRD